MTESFVKESGGPRTHALLVGVGDYPHLPNGALYQEDKPPTTFGLGQLRSATISASYFCDWLNTRLDNPTAPLGSVTLVRSTPRGGGTFKEIAKAFDSWLTRCNTYPDNVALFYFCGHGLENAAAQLLLASDFGKSPNRVMENAIDFTTTWYAMARCKAKCQLYILDSCRETPFKLLRNLAHPRELLTWDCTLTADRDAPILHAAARERKAFAEPGKPSVFVQQLVRCLDAFAAERRDGGRWRVSTASLRYALLQAMRRTRLADGSQASCAVAGESNDSVDIHSVDNAMVFASLGCHPQAALAASNIAVRGASTYQRGPGLFEPELPQGTYDIELRFSAPPYRDVVERDVLVNPPYFSWAPRVS